MSLESVIQIIMYVVIGLTAIVSSVIQFIKTGKFETTVSESSTKMTVQTSEQTKTILDRFDALESKMESLDNRVSDLEIKMQKCELLKSENSDKGAF